MLFYLGLWHPTGRYPMFIVLERIIYFLQAILLVLLNISSCEVKILRRKCVIDTTVRILRNLSLSLSYIFLLIWKVVSYSSIIARSIGNNWGSILNSLVKYFLIDVKGVVRRKDLSRKLVRLASYTYKSLALVIGKVLILRKLILILIHTECFVMSVPSLVAFGYSFGCLNC